MKKSRIHTLIVCRMIKKFIFFHLNNKKLNESQLMFLSLRILCSQDGIFSQKIET